jgi:hypothetical protein
MDATEIEIVSIGEKKRRVPLVSYKGWVFRLDAHIGDEMYRHPEIDLGPEEVQALEERQLRELQDIYLIS